MEYDLKTSKQIIADLCISKEFEDFKLALKRFNDGVDSSDVENVLESIISMGKSRDIMLARMNSAFKYKIEKYLTKSQLEEIDMIGSEDGVALVYKKYIPSYKKDGVYTSVDLTLLKIDFKNRVIYTPDIEKLFNDAKQYSREERLSERTKLEIQKQKINEMKMNRDSRMYVINTVREYNKNMISENAFERIKSFVNKSAANEYMVMYDEIISEMKEDYDVREKDFKMTKDFSYEDKLIELRDLQDGLMRRLAILNFNAKYGNSNQKINLASNPVSLMSVYK